jgi:hypothetical protein
MFDHMTCRAIQTGPCFSGRFETDIFTINDETSCGMWYLYHVGCYNGYVAEHWVTHGQFEKVSSFLKKAVEYLFDPNFVAWLNLHDIDIYPTSSTI